MSTLYLAAAVRDNGGGLVTTCDVIELVGQHVRTGGMVVADNTAARRDLYGRLLAYLGNPAHGFTSQTVPFDGGLELAVKTASS